MTSIEALFPNGAGPSDLRARNRNAKAVCVASLARQEVRFDLPRLNDLK